MISDKTKREILSPAGTYECFRAAINAGADAVYLGGSMFGARAFAGNFDNEELIKAIRTAHLYGRKVYLTVNTLLRNDELENLVEYIRPYYEEGLDAVIVQDYGVFAVLRDNFPGLDLHASTQMTITGKNGAQLLKKMGASRVVTARELSAEEIKDIHDNVDIEIESFVHGALCYCYSGQCLLSSMIGGRSGNRGRCAQPCRLTYSMNGIKDKYLLSPKDMCTIEAIPDILDAGVYSLKIEGRMKSPEYVAGVTYAYRKYVDMYLEKGRDGFKVDAHDITQLMDLYNRGGFCKGYYYSHNDKNMMTFNRPNHQGIVVGTVKNGEILLSEEINAGDVLEFADGSEYTVPAGKKNGRFALPKGAIRNTQNGTSVYRTRNNTLLAEIREKYIDKDIKLGLKMNICLKEGERAFLKVQSDDKATVVYGDILEKSEKHPATRADVIKQLKKLGGTAFMCDDADITVEIDGAPFVPVKLLNDLRRSALADIENEILSEGRRNIKVPDRNAGECTQNTKAGIRKTEKMNMTVQVMNKEQLHAVLGSIQAVMEGASAIDISRIYISTELSGIDGAISMKSMVDEYNGHISDDNRRVEVYLAMPYIFRERTIKLFDKKLENIKTAGFDGLLIRSTEELMYIKNNGMYELYEGRIIIDYNMYTYNKAAVDEYERLGINGFTLSEEQNAGQLKGLCRSVGKYSIERYSDVARELYLEKIAYGYLPLMVTAGCTLKYTSKDKPCGRAGVYYFTDRKGKKLAAINSCGYCYNLIFNSVPEYLLDKKEELKNMGVDAVRINFTIEKADEVEKIILTAGQSVKDYTRGHYNRGVD